MSVKKARKQKKIIRRLENTLMDRESELRDVSCHAEQLEKDNAIMEEHCIMQEAWRSKDKSRLSAMQKRLRYQRLETAKWRRTAFAGAAIMAAAVGIVAVATFAVPSEAADSIAESEPVVVCEVVTSSVSAERTSSVTAYAATPSPEGEGSALPSGEGAPEGQVRFVDGEGYGDDAPEGEENALIEAALFESGYFRSDIPLDGDTQAELRAACEEFGVQYELALAVIHQETGYRNVTGDGGKSVGFFQIQPRWNQKRMSDLGIRDLSVPYDNFRTGCSLLSDLIARYGLVGGLTAYNTGAPGTSAYASEVLAYMAGLEE